ncbi:RNA polymerase sigma-70 factor [Deminuibacter soli]|uniref:RNA polymerase sigma-70 factor n=1 Tax=Deminuibacter soli TaxID=2291815 RepID=A0A3E1NEB5_9BACT|nr:RNA polymerase sigma-70 factor [Deminuibacter soli]RFM26171.1 RNA polymerase sigma-70 factor [Deminuibacter soli]
MDTIAELKQNNKLAFDELYYRYHERIYFYFLGKSKSIFIAEEVTQITFIKLWQYRHNLSEEFSIYTQLFRIAKTSFVDVIRREKNMHQHSHLTEDSDAQINDVWEKIKERELRETADNIIKQMPEMRRKVFEMSRVEGMTYKEIADELSLSVKTIEAHMSQALKQLRNLIVLLLFLLCKYFF